LNVTSIVFAKMITSSQLQTKASDGHLFHQTSSSSCHTTLLSDLGIKGYLGERLHPPFTLVRMCDMPDQSAKYRIYSCLWLWCRKCGKLATPEYQRV